MFEQGLNPDNEALVEKQVQANASKKKMVCCGVVASVIIITGIVIAVLVTKSSTPADTTNPMSWLFTT